MQEGPLVGRLGSSPVISLAQEAQSRAGCYSAAMVSSFSFNVRWRARARAQKYWHEQKQRYRQTAIVASPRPRRVPTQHPPTHGARHSTQASAVAPVPLLAAALRQHFLP